MTTRKLAEELAGRARKLLLARALAEKTKMLEIVQSARELYPQLPQIDDAQALELENMIVGWYEKVFTEEELVRAIEIVDDPVYQKMLNLGAEFADEFSGWLMQVTKTNLDRQNDLG